jgi:hypothetical protein
MTVDFVAPPQAASDRIFQLACYQLRGFFYRLTYNEETRRGGYCVGEFIPILIAPRSAWGNPLLVSFMNAVLPWQLRLLPGGSRGLFQGGNSSQSRCCVLVMGTGVEPQPAHHRLLWRRRSRRGDYP